MKCILNYFNKFQTYFCCQGKTISVLQQQKNLKYSPLPLLPDDGSSLHCHLPTLYYQCPSVPSEFSICPSVHWALPSATIPSIPPSAINCTQLRPLRLLGIPGWLLYWAGASRWATNTTHIFQFIYFAHCLSISIKVHCKSVHIVQTVWYFICTLFLKTRRQKFI